MVTFYGVTKYTQKEILIPLPMLMLNYMEIAITIIRCT